MASKTSKTRPANSNANKIVIIERKPQPNWFVTAKNDFGEREWFLRFEVTGWYPRRFGPFKKKRQALLFLDSLLDQCGDAVSGAMNSGRSTIHDREIVEDKLASYYLTGRSGQPQRRATVDMQKGR